MRPQSTYALLQRGLQRPQHRSADRRSVCQPIRRAPSSAHELREVLGRWWFGARHLCGASHRHAFVNHPVPSSATRQHAHEAFSDSVIGHPTRQALTSALRTGPHIEESFLANRRHHTRGCPGWVPAAGSRSPARWVAPTMAGLRTSAASTPRAVDSMSIPSGSALCCWAASGTSRSWTRRSASRRREARRSCSSGATPGSGRPRWWRTSNAGRASSGSPWRRGTVSTSRLVSRSPRWSRRCGPSSVGSKTSGRGRRRGGCSPSWIPKHRGVRRRSMCWTTSPRPCSRRRLPVRC